jgi:hypothetical protein
LFYEPYYKEIFRALQFHTLQADLIFVSKNGKLSQKIDKIGNLKQGAEKTLSTYEILKKKQVEINSVQFWIKTFYSPLDKSKA